MKIRHGIWLLSIPVFCAASLRAAVTFSSVEARQARDTTAIILWHNEVPGTIPAPLAGQVEYGPDAGYGSQTPQDDFSFFHSVTLNGLAPSTTYHYRLRVKDRGDVETLSEDHTFVTLSAPAAQSVTGIAPNSAGETVVNDDTVWQATTAVCGGNITVGNSAKTVSFTIKDSAITIPGGMIMGGDTPVDFTLVNSTIVFDVQSGSSDTITAGCIDGSRRILVKDTMNLSKASRIELRDSTIRGTDAAYRAGGVYIMSGYTGYASPVTQHQVIIDNVTFAFMGGLATNGAGYWALDVRWWDGYSGDFAPGSLLTNIKLVTCGKGIRMSGEKKLDYAYACRGACAFDKGRYYEHVYMNKVYEGLYEPENGALVRHSWFDGNGTKFNFNTGSNGIFEYNYVRNAAFNAGDGGGNGNIVRHNVLYCTGIGSRKDYTQYVDNQIDSTGFEYGVNMGGLHQTADGNTVTGVVRFAFNIVPHLYTTLPAGWHTISNNTVYGTQYGFRIGSFANGTLEETNNTYINNSISSTTVGCGIWLCNSAHQLFVNTKILHTATYDIAFLGNNTDSKFINTKFNPAKVAFNNANDVFLSYYYLNVKVQDIDGNPVDGATVAVANEIDNARYPSINCNGEAKYTATTGPEGTTPLPSLPADSLAVLDYAQSSATIMQMSYTITAEKKGARSIVSGITPDAGWYRENPEVPAATVVITLPLSLQAINAIGTVMVYPNPYIKGKSPGKNIVFGNLPKESTLRLYTMAGAPVTTFRHAAAVDGGSEEWDVSGVPGGIYLYTITDSRGTVKGKVSIVK